MKIRYQDVESSNISALAFNDGVTYVEFNGGRRYAYKMSRPDFNALKEAKSIGSHFAKYVKSKCPVVWNGHRCDCSPCKNDATKVGHAGNDPKVGTFRVCDSCATTAPQFRTINFTPLSETKP